MKMKSSKESRRHHYVPEFLLAPWQRNSGGQNVLHGVYWHPHKRQLYTKSRGLKSFCNQLDLLSLKNHKLGRDALEKIFFGQVDDSGAKVRDLMISKGVASLNGEQRSNFAALLLSLEVRRPQIVKQVRALEPAYIEMLDSDADLLTLMKQIGTELKPSEYYESKFAFLADKAMLFIQRLVDNAKVGKLLINSKWKIISANPGDESLILADRPLVRVHGFSDPNWCWLLPLSPERLFVAANNPLVIDQIHNRTTNRIAKDINVLSAKQVERFAFTASDSHAKWLERFLRPQ